MKNNQLLQYEEYYIQKLYNAYENNRLDKLDDDLREKEEKALGIKFKTYGEWILYKVKFQKELTKQYKLGKVNKVNEVKYNKSK